MISFLIGAAALASFQPAPCALEGAAPDVETVNGLECGWISVPRAATSADRKMIRLWAARIRAVGSPSLDDPILFINGGPGVATVDSVLPAVPHSRNIAMLRRNRDVILFDQRGSGRSEEALCPNLAGELNAIEGAGLGGREEEERNRNAFAACRRAATAAGYDVDAYTTDRTVADMESVRHAFGVERWNLVSVSYGSLVAMHAMRTTPDSIRSVILNSPYPPNSVSWAEQVTSTAAGYAAIDRACSRQPSCRDRFGPLLPKLEATLLRLERSPIRDGDRIITGRLFAESLWPVAVQSRTVRFVPLAIDRAYSGDEDVIRKIVSVFGSGDAFGSYSPAQGMAIACHESGRTEAFFARARSLHPQLSSTAPDDSWDRVCEVYRPGFARADFFAPVASDIPTLIYAGSLDPATPTVDAFQATRFLSRVTLLEVAGAAHAPMSQDDCTRGIAESFLAQPEVQPNLACMANRETMEFALDGLGALLNPPSR